MVIDAHEGRFVSEATAKTGLRRDEVIGTPLALQVFAFGGCHLAAGPPAVLIRCGRTVRTNNSISVF